MTRQTPARSILGGAASGPVIASPEALSFWGGVNPATGSVIDVHHPLHDTCLTGSILLMPSSRGSCTGSGVLPDSAALEAITRAAVRFYDAHLIVRTRPFPGVAEALAGLSARGVRMGICTNKRLAPAQHILAGLGLGDYFEAVIARESCPLPVRADCAGGCAPDPHAASERTTGARKRARRAITWRPGC